MALVKSLVLSLLLSVAATYLLRRLLSATNGPPGHPAHQHINPVIVIVPTLVGNSGNRLIEIRTETWTSPLSWLGTAKRK